jgi:hypothetical protein
LIAVGSCFKVDDPVDAFVVAVAGCFEVDDPLDAFAAVATDAGCFVDDVELDSDADDDDDGTGEMNELCPRLLSLSCTYVLHIGHKMVGVDFVKSHRPHASKLTFTLQIEHIGSGCRG